jgi:conjugative transfer signal peptidase TraF
MRRALEVLAVAFIAGCVVQCFWVLRPILIWNVTASAPIGLWRAASGGAQRGAWVLVRLPDGIADFASRRRYLPHNVPMVKRIAALSGDTVCSNGSTVRVNGAAAATALAQDAKGRALPAWRGCRRLGEGEFFLLTTPPQSFDSRYFGPVSHANLIERITPLWTF